MSEEVERLLVRIDASTETLRRELKKADKAVRDSNSKMQNFTDDMQKRWAGVEKSVKRHNSQIKLVGAAATAGVVVAVKKIADYSDTYKSLQGQLKLVTTDQNQLNDVWEKSLTIANNTGSSLDSTITLYARMARATEELGVNQSDLLQMTDTINKAFVVSGATTEEASASVIQLSQAMAKGRLDGQELNAVLEQSPRLARLIAEEMNQPIGALKELGSQGKITSDVMVSAFRNGADAIDNEFGEMPVTVGRALNEVQNQMLNAFGQTDLSPLTTELQKFADIVSDPAAVEGLMNIAGALVTVASKAASVATVLPGLAKFMAEGLASFSGPAADDMVRTAERIEFLTNKIKAFDEASNSGAPRRASHIIKQYRQELKKLTSVYNFNIEQTKQNTDATDKAAAAAKKKAKADKAAAAQGEENVETAQDYNKELKELEKALKRTEKQQDKNVEAFDKGHQALEDIVRETDQYIDALRDELQATKESERQQFILNAVRDGGTRATAEQVAEIERLAAALYDQNKAVEASEKAAEQMQEVWDGARGTLSDFFFEFARDGENAFDNLLKSFEAMLSKMIAEAAANQILIGVGVGSDALGFGDGLLNAAKQGSGALDLFSAGSSASSLYNTALSSPAGWAFAQNSSLFANQGLQLAVPGDGGAALTPQFSFANAAAGAAGGLAGGYLGREAFGGNTTGVGATVGGIAGTLIPGVGAFGGAAIGSFLGEGLETAIGNLLGFGSGGSNQAIADFSGGQFEARGVGKSFDKKNLDAIESLAGGIGALVTLVGNDDFSGRIRLGNKNGFQYKAEGASDGTRYANAEDLLDAVFDDVIRGAEGLDSELKALLLSFDGTAQETLNYSKTMLMVDAMTQNLDDSLRDWLFSLEDTNETILSYAQSFAMLSDASNVNTVTAAIEDFNRVQPTLYQSYTDQTAALKNVLQNVDGSAESYARLSDAFIRNKSIAYEFAMAIQAIGKELQAAAEGQAQYFRESILSPEELRQQRQRERDALRESLGNLTDPEEIEEAGKRILDLNRQIFDSLTEGQREAQAESFALYTESTNATIQDLLAGTLDGMQRSQADLNREVGNLLSNAGQQFQAAANQQVTAAQINLEASQNQLQAAQINAASFAAFRTGEVSA